MTKITKPCISKEEFIKILEKYRIQTEKLAKFTKSLEKMCSSHVLFDTENQYLDALIDLLEMVFRVPENFRKTTSSDYSTIQWYLFEQNCMYYNEYKLRPNDESIYEILVAEMQSDINNHNELLRNTFEKYGEKIDTECFLEVLKI